MKAPRRLAAVPGLDDVASRPELVADLHPSEVYHLLIKHATLGGILLGRLLITGRDALGAVPAPSRPILDGKEAAEYLRVPKSALDRMRRAGEVHGSKTGKGYTYRRDELDRLHEKMIARCPSS